MLTNIANLAFRLALRRHLALWVGIGVNLSHPCPIDHKGETQIFVTKCVEKTHVLLFICVQSLGSSSILTLTNRGSLTTEKLHRKGVKDGGKYGYRTLVFSFFFSIEITNKKYQSMKQRVYCLVILLARYGKYENMSARYWVQNYYTRRQKESILILLYFCILIYLYSIIPVAYSYSLWLVNICYLASKVIMKHWHKKSENKNMRI